MVVDIDKVKALAKFRGLKLSHVCAEIGEDPTYFDKVKKGLRRMDDDRIAFLAEKLGTSRDFLEDESNLDLQLMESVDFNHVNAILIHDKQLDSWDIGVLINILYEYGTDCSFKTADLVQLLSRSNHTVLKEMSKLTENGYTIKISDGFCWQINREKFSQSACKKCTKPVKKIHESVKIIHDEKEERTKEESIDIPYVDSLNNTSSSCRSIYSNANVEQTDEVQNLSRTSQESSEFEPNTEEVQDKLSFDDVCREIVTYLNEKTGQRFSPKSAATRELIQARLDEDFVVDDFKTVIDKKCEEWIDDQKMKMYLRPITLFGKNFERYLTEDIRIRRGANGWDIDLDADDDMKDIFTDETWGGWNGRNTHH